MKYLKRFNEDVRTRNSKAEYNAYRKEKLSDIKSDVEQMFDIEGLEITTKDFGNIYLDINFEVNTYIDPDENKEDFDRLIDYMASRGYEFNYFDTYRVYWMGRMILTWKDLFDIPHHYKKQMNKLTIHFHNMKWEEEDAKFGINESTDWKEAELRRDIDDILLDVKDDGFDPIVMRRSNWLKKSYNNEIIVTIKKAKSEKPMFDYDEVKPTLDRLTEYMNRQGYYYIAGSSRPAAYNVNKESIYRVVATYRKPYNK